MELKTIEDVSSDQERNFISILLKRGNASAARKLILSGTLPLDIKFRNLMNRSLLHLLVFNPHHNETLEWLLANRFDQLNLDARDDTLSTPLLLAAEAKNIPAIKLLLSYGANPDAANNVKQQLMDVVEIYHPYAVNEVRRLLHQSQEGTLLPSLLPESTLQHQHSVQASHTSSNRSDNTDIKAVSSFSLWALIEKIKSPIFGHRSKKPNSEFSDLLEESSPDSFMKFKTQ